MVNRIFCSAFVLFFAIAGLSDCATRGDLVRSQEYTAGLVASQYATKVEVAQVATSAEAAIRAVDARASKTYATKAEVKEAAANAQAVANAAMQQAQQGLVVLAQRLAGVEKGTADTRGTVAALDVKVSGLAAQERRNKALLDGLAAQRRKDMKALTAARRIAQVGAGAVEFHHIGPFGLGEAAVEKLPAMAKKALEDLNANVVAGKVEVLGVIGLVDGVRCKTLTAAGCQTPGLRRAQSVAAALHLKKELATGESAPEGFGNDAELRGVKVVVRPVAQQTAAVATTAPPSVPPAPVAPAVTPPASTPPAAVAPASPAVTPVAPVK